MPVFFRKHAATFVIAFVTAMVAGGSFVWAHNAPSDGHVTLAHKANKVEGLTILPLKKLASSFVGSSEEEARLEAKRIPLYSSGPLSVYGKCFSETSQTDNPGMFARIYLDTTRAGTVFDTADHDDSGNGFVGPDTDETDLELLTVSSYSGAPTVGTVNISDGDYMDFWAAAGQTHLTGQLFAGTRVGPTSSDGVFGEEKTCFFGGTITSR
jgi:hypothetical protein